MPLSDLLSETLETPDSDCWGRERTANALTGVAVRLHSAGLSLRETMAILDLLDVDRSVPTGTERSGRIQGRNHIERWFQTLKQRTDRFYTTWNGGPASTRRWLQRSVHYYNTQRRHQALNGRTPAEKA